MASTTLRPDNTLASGDWLAHDGAAATATAILDDPDSPSTSDYIEDPATVGANAEFTLTTATRIGTVSNVDLRVYGTQGDEVLTTPSWQCELRKADETVLATVAFPENTPEGLRNTSAAVSLTQSDVDGLKLVFVSTGETTTALRRCYAVAVDLVHTIVGGDLALLGAG